MLSRARGNISGRHVKRELLYQIHCDNNFDNMLYSLFHFMYTFFDFLFFLDSVDDWLPYRMCVNVMYPQTIFIGS